LPKEKKPPKESELIPETRTTFLSNRRYNGKPNKSPRPDIIYPATTRIEIYDKGSRSRTPGPISLSVSLSLSLSVSLSLCLSLSLSLSLLQLMEKE
jgi:hypothetical protein